MSTTSSSRPVRSYALRCRAAPLPCSREAPTRDETSSQSRSRAVFRSPRATLRDALVPHPGAYYPTRYARRASWRRARTPESAGYGSRGPRSDTPPRPPGCTAPSPPTYCLPPLLTARRKGRPRLGGGISAARLTQSVLCPLRTPRPDQQGEGAETRSCSVYVAQGKDNETWIREDGS